MPTNTEENIENNQSPNVISDNPDSLASSEEKDQNKAMPRSHLRKTLEKQSKKTLFLTGIGLLTVMILLVIYGQTLLVNFSVILGDTKNSATQNATTDEEKPVFIPAPILDPQNEATNSAKVTVSGVSQAETKAQIRLYVNDELADVVEPGRDDTFLFKDVPLTEGVNKIKAVTKLKDKISSSSNELIITYIKNPPSLSIDEPKDGVTYTGPSNTLTVKGKTDDGNTVTVNDYIAITKNDGAFTYNLKLQNGENRIKVIAKDAAGNTAEKEIKVTYSP